MPIDTYEFSERSKKLETYEWDDIWWDNAPDEKARRILIIGDSISRGYRRAASKMQGRDFFIDGIATSKAADSATFRTLLDYFAESGLSYDAVFFNNGLHGWHLDEESFGEHFRALAAYIKEKFAPKSFYLVTTTPARRAQSTDIFDPRNERVKVRNAAIASAAQKNGAEVLDFYSLLESRAELYTADGIHLVDEGYILLGNQIIKAASN